MTSKLTSDERLVKILSETQATIMEHNSRCVRGSVEVDAQLFESMIMELQERRKAAMDGEPVARILRHGPAFKGLCDFTQARTYEELPMSAVAESNGYWLEGHPLYLHAQPAPNFKKLARELVENLVDCGGLDVGVKGKYLKWTEKTCRAAMLASAPQEVKK